MPITINGSGTVTGLSAGGLPDGSVTPADLSQPLTLGTAQATTSGTSIDFTGIPSWVKRITVMFNGVSTNGTTAVLVQLGTSGGVEATGYAASLAAITGANTCSISAATTGFTIVGSLATNTRSGLLTIANVTGNTWVCSGTIVRTDDNVTGYTQGTKTLGGVLDRIRITAGGTDTFDAGSINIMYE